MKKTMVPKSDDEWKGKLDEMQYKVLRQKATEMPFTGKLLANKADGDYTCAGCGSVLFSSKAKFDSGTGWPSFDEPANSKNVVLKRDESHGMARTEVLCKKCGGHLGHVFNDGPTKSGERYCINSCALQFNPRDKKK